MGLEIQNPGSQLSPGRLILVVGGGELGEARKYSDKASEMARADSWGQYRLDGGVPASAQ